MIKRIVPYAIYSFWTVSPWIQNKYVDTVSFGLICLFLMFSAISLGASFFAKDLIAMNKSDINLTNPRFILRVACCLSFLFAGMYINFFWFYALALFVVTHVVKDYVAYRVELIK